MPIEFNIKGLPCFIDDIDADLLLLQPRWTPLTSKKSDVVYLRRYGGKDETGKRLELRIHRVIMERIVGRSLLTSEEVDHKDGNGLNNQRSNLRIATHSQNQANRPARKDNKTGFRGVSWSKKDKRYVAVITVNGKRYGLGYFTSLHIAHEAYKKASIELFGEFAWETQNVNEN